MTRLVDAVQRAAADAVVQRGSAWFLATVDVVNTGGTVDISTATGPALRVRRLKHYTPTVGDHVMVTVNADGNWLVVGATAS